MPSSAERMQRFAAFKLGDFNCLCMTSNLNAVTQTPTQPIVIPGTKPYFIGNCKIGRDIVSYFDLPAFFGISNSKTAQSTDLHTPTSLIIRDREAGANHAGAVYGLTTDRVLAFIPVSEIEDAPTDEHQIPAMLAPFSAGVVKARGELWTLINLEAIINDKHFRSIELPV